MNLYLWAQRWGIPTEAIHDLRNELGVIKNTTVDRDMSESATSQRALLESSRHGWLMMRNNVGAFKTDKGSLVRYGLLNETKQQNKKFKSSDFIGIAPTVIKQSDVGTVKGIFVAREMKHATWQWSGDEHEQAQHAFHVLVTSFGGDAKFCTGPRDLL